MTTGRDQLSRRERQILELVAQGKRDKEIATEAGISIHTVRAHVRNISRVLGATNRAHAVRLAGLRRRAVR